MTRHALVIGISEYQILPRLESVVKDVEEIACVLKESGNYIVDRYPYKYIKAEDRYEINPKEATRDNLLKKIEEFLFETAKYSDALLYFSGHGLRVKSISSRILPKGYLCASDSKNDGSNALALADLNVLFSQAREEAHLSSLVVILDCCHAGMAIEYENAIEYSMINNEFSRQQKYALLAACRSHQEAYFIQGDQSVLTKVILDGFKDPKNADEEGIITFSRLVTFVKSKLNNQGQQAIEFIVDAVDLEIIRHAPPVQTNAKFSDFQESLCQLNYGHEDGIFKEFLDAASPVGAFWINGERGGGQSWLLKRFWGIKHNYLFTGAVKKKFNINKRWSIETVWEKVGNWLGSGNNPQAIVDAIYQHWSNHVTVMLVLSGVEKLESVVLQQLCENLWQPLAEKATQKQSEYPLILFLINTDTHDDLMSLQVNNRYSCNNAELPVRLNLNRFDSRILERWGNQHQQVLSQQWRTALSLEEFKERIINYNNREDFCNEDVLEKICSECGWDWENDFVTKFTL